jgi:hypothetical protein
MYQPLGHLKHQLLQEMVLSSRRQKEGQMLALEFSLFGML